MWILPDGTETEIKRRGIASIIEQKKLIKQAKKLNVDCIVAEVMSIHAENHFVESQQILKPQFVILTNVRLDHTEAMGNTIEKIASVFTLDIPEQATLFIPAGENQSIFSTTVKHKGGQLIAAPPGIGDRLRPFGFTPMQNEFSENIDLAIAVAKHFNIEDRVIASGLGKAKHDIGHLKIWRFSSERNKKTCFFVNGFAANDPQSTLDLISKIKTMPSLSSQQIHGLLTLRKDRAERTLQWIQFLKSENCDIFSHLFVSGAQASIVRRKLKRGIVLNQHTPEKIMETISEHVNDNAVIFGFGNIGGKGKILIDYLNRCGVDYGL